MRICKPVFAALVTLFLHGCAAGMAAYGLATGAQVGYAAYTVGEATVNHATVEEAINDLSSSEGARPSLPEQCEREALAFRDSGGKLPPGEYLPPCTVERSLRRQGIDIECGRKERKRRNFSDGKFPKGCIRKSPAKSFAR